MALPGPSGLSGLVLRLRQQIPPDLSARWVPADHLAPWGRARPAHQSDPSVQVWTALWAREVPTDRQDPLLQVYQEGPPDPWGRADRTVPTPWARATPPAPADPAGPTRESCGTSSCAAHQPPA